MAIDRNADIWLSAVVQLRPPEERVVPGAPADEVTTPQAPKVPEGVHIAPAPGEAPREVKVPVATAQMARAKQFFTSSGFEVHAPVGATFSIGARQSVFERFFGVTLHVDPDQLGTPVEVEGGGRELSLDPLSEEVRGVVASITFPPPVELRVAGR